MVKCVAHHDLSRIQYHMAQFMTVVSHAPGTSRELVWGLSEPSIFLQELRLSEKDKAKTKDM
jgi:hypothetical protein